MSSVYADTLVAAHFNMFRTPDPPAGTKLSAVEKRVLERRKQFLETGRGYFEIQGTKPFTIGLAIASSPLAVLAYIGEKIYSWSDPDLVDPMDILDTVALYFLSGSFATSVVIYNQVRFRTMYAYASWLLIQRQSFKQRNELNSPPEAQERKVKSKLGFSSFVSAIFSHIDTPFTAES